MNRIKTTAMVNAQVKLLLMQDKLLRQLAALGPDEKEPANEIRDKLHLIGAKLAYLDGGAFEDRDKYKDEEIL